MLCGSGICPQIFVNCQVKIHCVYSYSKLVNFFIIGPTINPVIITARDHRNLAELNCHRGLVHCSNVICVSEIRCGTFAN